MAQVVAVQAFVALAATGVQLFSGTPVGPVVDGAGHLMVTQLLPALPVWATQEPGGVGTVSEWKLQKVAVLPLPEPAFAGVQVPTFCSGVSSVRQLVMTQLVFAPPPGVHDATRVSGVVTVRQLTKLGPVVLGTHDDTGTSGRVVGVQVVLTPLPVVLAVHWEGRTCVFVGPVSWHARSRKLLLEVGACAVQLPTLLHPVKFAPPHVVRTKPFELEAPDAVQLATALFVMICSVSQMVAMKLGELPSPAEQLVTAVRGLVVVVLQVVDM